MQYMIHFSTTHSYIYVATCIRHSKIEFALNNLNSTQTNKMNADKMAKRQKRIKFNYGKPKKFEESEKPSTSTKTTKFLDMNDDCILAICEKLDVTGLQSMKSTCLRLYRLASGHFQRKYTDKRIDVDCKRKQPLNFKISGEYQKHFHSDIRNVRINGRNAAMHNIFKFIAANVCANLKHLQLDNFRGDISEKYGRFIEDQLKQVQSLTINNFQTTSDIYEGLLENCENLQEFSIRTERDANADWLLHNYPHLKRVSFDFRDKNHRKKFDKFAESFFQLNQQLQTITCSNVDTMRTVLMKIQSIDRIVLKFESLQEIEQIYDALIAFSEKKIGWLEVICPSECHRDQKKTKTMLKRLANVNRLHTIRNLMIQYLDDVVYDFTPPIESLQQLEVHIDYEEVDHDQWLENIVQYTNLIDLYLEFRSPFSLCVLIHQLIEPIIRFLPKLKTIHLSYDGKILIGFYDSKILSMIRSTLPGACQTTIHVQINRWTKSIMQFKDPLNNLVKIEFKDQPAA